MLQHTTKQALPRLLKAREVSEMTSMSRPTIYALVKQGSFPRPIQLSEKRLAWREADIVQWIDSRNEVRWGH